MKSNVFFRFFLVFFISYLAVKAQIPEILNYQGNLIENAKPVSDGKYSITFNLYENLFATTPLWTEGHAGFF